MKGKWERSELGNWFYFFTLFHMWNYLSHSHYNMDDKASKEWVIDAGKQTHTFVCEMIILTAMSPIESSHQNKGDWRKEIIIKNISSDFVIFYKIWVAIAWV
jgi:hypothetical protein